MVCEGAVYTLWSHFHRKNLRSVIYIMCTHMEKMLEVVHLDALNFFLLLIFLYFLDF